DALPIYLRQLDEERPGGGDGRPSRSAGLARRRRVEVLELVAPHARARRRLQPERSQEYRRQRPLLLLRHEIVSRRPADVGEMTIPKESDQLARRRCRTARHVWLP